MSLPNENIFPDVYVAYDSASYTHIKEEVTLENISQFIENKINDVLNYGDAFSTSLTGIVYDPTSDLYEFKAFSSRPSSDIEHAGNRITLENEIDRLTNDPRLQNVIAKFESINELLPYIQSLYSSDSKVFLVGMRKEGDFYVVYCFRPTDNFNEDMSNATLKIEQIKQEIEISLIQILTGQQISKEDINPGDNFLIIEPDAFGTIEIKVGNVSKLIEIGGFNSNIHGKQGALTVKLSNTFKINNLYSTNLSYIEADQFSAYQNVEGSYKDGRLIIKWSENKEGLWLFEPGAGLVKDSDTSTYVAREISTRNVIEWSSTATISDIKGTFSLPGLYRIDEEVYRNLVEKIKLTIEGEA